MMIVSLRQHSVVVLLIGGIALSIALSGSAFAQIKMDMSKGQPVSSTYLELWCRTFDENFVVLSKPREMAFHAGFDGQRAERTWRGRLEILADLNFIGLKEGPSGPMSYALIWNPYKVIKDHHDKKAPGLRQDKYNALLERMSEIGDASITPAREEPEPKKARK